MYITTLLCFLPIILVGGEFYFQNEEKNKRKAITNYVVRPIYGGFVTDLPPPFTSKIQKEHIHKMIPIDPLYMGLNISCFSFSLYNNK